jgi:hypothetical protein
MEIVHEETCRRRKVARSAHAEEVETVSENVLRARPRRGPNRDVLDLVSSWCSVSMRLLYSVVLIPTCRTPIVLPRDVIISCFDGQTHTLSLSRHAFAILVRGTRVHTIDA